MYFFYGDSDNKYNDYLEKHEKQFSNPHKHILNLRKQLKERRDELISALEISLQNRMSYSVPEGGIHLWCKINAEIDEDKLLKESMKNGVAFVPGSIMGSKEGYVRFTYGKGDKQSIREGVSRFVRALQSFDK